MTNQSIKLFMMHVFQHKLSEISLLEISTHDSQLPILTHVASCTHSFRITFVWQNPGATMCIISVSISTKTINE